MTTRNVRLDSGHYATKYKKYVLSIVTGQNFEKMQSCATYFLAAACAIKRAMKIGKVLRERPFLHFIWSDEYLTP